MIMSTHIDSIKSDIAKIVIMPGDPLRAKFIAETYLSNYKQINSTRNMFGYTGYYKDKQVTVMASGMGNPSMGIYSYELYNFYDVDTIIRVGTCGSYRKDINVFDLILVDNSYSNSSYAYNLLGYNINKINSSDVINNIIIDTAKNMNLNINKGNIYCTDTFYQKEELVDKSNYLGVEMETFALFTNAKLLNKNSAAILTVSDSLVTKEEISKEEREKHTIKMIELALESILKI